MLGDSAVLGTGGGGSGDAVAAAPPVGGAAAASGGAHDGGVDGGDGGGGGSNSGDDRVEEAERSFGGNRWPRQETLALLKIRSDMDVAFRDASVKGPLWEEVSRKLAELGYNRNAKKCKEKFENVYKYHKRTKEGRSGKSEGKAYRFFDQLQALENNPAIHGKQSPTPTPTPSKPPLASQTTALPATPVSIVVTTTTTASSIIMPLPLPPVSNNNKNTTVPSTTSLPMPQSILNITPPSTLNITTPSFPPSNPTTYFPTQTPNPTSNNNNNNNNNPPSTITPPSFPNFPADLLSNSSSSSTSSEETPTTEAGGRKRKRKWKDFFERLMKEVIEKQEELQRRFLEAIEKREQERVVREEAWRMQEMQRINREREILAQERSIAAAKDDAVMTFLQKIAEHQQQETMNLEPALNNSNSITVAPQQPVPQATPTSTPTPQQAQTTTVPEAPQVQPLVPQLQQQQIVVSNVEINKADNNGENLMMGASSSRWPKVEVQALINLRISLETKYQESGPKGPLWEEISALMRKMGYNRNAKRCKEKWENINKYFKKVKESNKKRPEDSKTCPYFHQLDALYREKNKGEGQMKPESMMAPLMVQPEQQWPPQTTHVVPPEVAMGDAQNDPMDRQYHEENEEDEDNKEIGDEDEDEDEEGGDNYEIVASKPTSADASGE